MRRTNYDAVFIRDTVSVSVWMDSRGVRQVDMTAPDDGSQETPRATSSEEVAARRGKHVWSLRWSAL